MNPIGSRSMMMIFGGAFLVRWVGPQFRSLEPVMLVLVVGTICSGAQMPTVQFLFGTGRHKYYAKTNLIHGVLVLGSTMALVVPFGLLGVAIGTTVPTIALKFFVQPIYACRAMQVPLGWFYGRHAVRNLLVPVPYLLVVWLATRPFLRPEDFNILFLAGVACLLYVPYILLVGFTREERQRLLASARLRRPRNDDDDGPTARETSVAPAAVETESRGSRVAVGAAGESEREAESGVHPGA